MAKKDSKELMWHACTRMEAAFLLMLVACAFAHDGARLFEYVFLVVAGVEFAWAEVTRELAEKAEVDEILKTGDERR